MLKAHNAAYTLVEALLVVAILSLFVGVGFANFRDFSRRHKAEAFLRQLTADLRLAQELSLSGHKPDDPPGFCTADTSLEGREELAGIEFSVTSTGYQFRAYCENTEVQPPTPSYSAAIKSVTVPSEITLTTNPSATTALVFRSLARGTDLTGNITISICTDTQDLAVTISPEGKITQDNTVSCP